MNWHLEILPRATCRALDLLSKEEWLSSAGWYLAGGTALALQAGHRQSVDLDFFIPKKTFPAAEVTSHFSDETWQADTVRDGTIYGILSGAKVSFIAYPFFVFGLPRLKYGLVDVLDQTDIAVMKVIAISQRGRKRDFIDLYWYTKHISPLFSVIEKLPAQYPTVAHDFHHIIKSLTYFTDAEDDPMPDLFFETSWEEIKKYFQREVPIIAKKVIGLD